MGGSSKRLEEYYQRVVYKLLREASHKADSQKELCLRIQAIETTIKGLGGNLSPEVRNELLETLAEAKRVAGCKRTGVSEMRPEAVFLVVFLAVVVPPLPPQVPLAVSVQDPFGFRIVASTNGTTLVVGFGSPIRIRIKPLENASVQAEVVLTSTETGDSVTKVFNETGRLPIGNLTDPGLRTLTLKASRTVNGTVVETAFLTITLSVLTPEETAKYRSEKVTETDPRRVKYVYAMVSSFAFSLLGIEFGYTLKAKRTKKVTEL